MRKTLFGQKLNNKFQKIIHSDVRQSTTKKIIASIIAIFLAFAIAIIIACSVCNVWDKFGNVMNSIFTAGYKSQYQNTLFSNMAILIVGGLAFVFAYKAGLFNIGISGQMVAGATVATMICHLCKIAPGANQIVIILVSMGMGAFVASIVGALKAYLKINEVVSSIMFNWIIYFMSILLLGSIKGIPHDAANLNTDAPVDSLLLRMNGESWIPLMIIAVVLIIAISIILNYTVFGRKQKVTGLSNTGALAAGYNVKANMIASMAISGAISGLLGVMLYCGFSPNMPVTAAAKAIPQEGFNGISVGLISMCSPVASIPVSLFFSMIKTAVSDLQLLGIDNHIADVVFGIVVYGAAAISLFLNIKPYWLTLEIVKGKNYSKIKHERNMTNIELLALSGEQCSILKKYYVYYQKTVNVKQTLKLSPAVHFNMFIANIRYKLALRKAARNVKRNSAVCIISNKTYFKQEMVHVVIIRDQLVADLKNEKRGGWYIKPTDALLARPDLRNHLEELTEAVCSPGFISKLREANKQLKERPFNSKDIRLVPLLAYLQNLRTGLAYRDQITKENKLAYFTFMQTKEQAESIGMNEIRSRAQYQFAHTAYFKAYQRTFEVVKNHYDSMVKTYGRGKQLNVYGIRFDSATLSNLYIRNLKEEIANIAYLINCPLNKMQLHEVAGLVSRAGNLREEIEADTKTSTNNRKLAMKHASRSAELDKDVKQYQADNVKNAHAIAKIVNITHPLTDKQVNELSGLVNDTAKLNKLAYDAHNQSIGESKMSNSIIEKTKPINKRIVNKKDEASAINKKLAIIAEAARKAEKKAGIAEYDKLKESNAKVDAILEKIAKKQEQKELAELRAIKLAKLKEKQQKEREIENKLAYKAKMRKLAIIAQKHKKEALIIQKIKDDMYVEAKLKDAKLAQEYIEHQKVIDEAKKQIKAKKSLEAIERAKKKQLAIAQRAEEAKKRAEEKQILKQKRLEEIKQRKLERKAARKAAKAKAKEARALMAEQKHQQELEAQKLRQEKEAQEAKERAIREKQERLEQIEREKQRKAQEAQEAKERAIREKQERLEQIEREKQRKAQEAQEAKERAIREKQEAIEREKQRKAHEELLARQKAKKEAEKREAAIAKAEAKQAKKEAREKAKAEARAKKEQERLERAKQKEQQRQEAKRKLAEQRAKQEAEKREAKEARAQAKAEAKAKKKQERLEAKRQQKEQRALEKQQKREAKEAAAKAKQEIENVEDAQPEAELDKEGGK